MPAIPFQKVQQDGWSFYVVEADSVLYRGDSGVVGEAPDFRPLEYFAPDRQTAEIYGIVSQFRSKCRLFLLAMDEISNLRRLYEECRSPRVLNAITQVFGYEPDNEHINRRSDPTTDRVVAEYICGKGLDGYAHDYVPSEEFPQRGFHPEIVICDPRRYVEFEKTMDYDEETIAERMREHRLLRQSQEDRRQREEGAKKNRRRFQIEDDNDDEDRPRVGRVLFG